MTTHFGSDVNSIAFNHIDRFYSKARLLDFLSISNSTLYRLMKEDTTFPQLYRLSARRVAWKESEVMIWANSKGAARKAETMN